MKRMKRGLALLCAGVLLFTNLPVYAKTGEGEPVVEETIPEVKEEAEKAAPKVETEERVAELKKEVLVIKEETLKKETEALKKETEAEKKESAVPSSVAKKVDGVTTKEVETIATVFPNSVLAAEVARQLKKKVTDPFEEGDVEHITGIYIHENEEFKSLIGIGRLTNLTYLDLVGNQLTSVPAEIGELTNLTYLGLVENQLTSIPAEICNLTNLVYICLENNQLVDIPQELYDFVKASEDYWNCLSNQTYDEILEKPAYINETYEFQGLPVYTQLPSYGVILTYELISPSENFTTEGISVDEVGKVKIAKDNLQEEGTYQLCVSAGGEPWDRARMEENGEFYGSVYTQSFEVSERVVVTGITEIATNGTVGEPLALEGMISPENASSQEIIWTIEDVGTTEAILEGNMLLANKPGTIKVKATIADGLGQGIPYEQTFEIEMIQTGLYQVNPDGNTVSGLKSSYKENEDIVFTAIGDGRVGETILIGDERYTPVSWSINPSGTWSKAPYTATTKIAKAGTYQLQITYNKEVYDGSKWNADGTTDLKSTKVVVEKEKTTIKDKTDKDKATNKSVNKAVKTGDVASNSILLLLIGSILVLFVQSKKRKSL